MEINFSFSCFLNTLVLYTNLDFIKMANCGVKVANYLCVHKYIEIYGRKEYEQEE